ncbi:hypothetical protein [Hathewaya proteolytica]|nr:hypothetical protein [Hathewaya proteolytica]
MYWLRNFMRGRYGVDQFSKFILAVGILLAFIGALFGKYVFSFLANVTMLFFIYRTLSKNIGKRQHENNIFISVFSPFQMKYYKMKKRLTDSKTYKYFKCPNCKQQLRVPRGKGSLTITCPKCKEKFDKKS